MNEYKFKKNDWRFVFVGGLLPRKKKRNIRKTIECGDLYNQTENIGIHRFDGLNHSFFINGLSSLYFHLRFGLVWFLCLMAYQPL